MNATETNLAESRECEECGGRGFDSGSLDPFGEVCPNCLGSGVEPLVDEPGSIPWTIPAASSVPRIGPSVVSIGNGLYVRAGGSAS